MKRAPEKVVKLRKARREKEVIVKSITRKLTIRWRKSREDENPRADVTHRSIKYFMLQPKAKAPLYLQPGEVVAVKIDAKWDSSYLWSMANEEGEGEVPSSKQQDLVLGSSCDICNDGTVKLFVEEVQYLVNKLPFTCQHKG